MQTSTTARTSALCQTANTPSLLKNIRGKTYPHGDFVDEEGNVLGEHKGIIRYTIGQRKGLGLALKHPMYVKQKDLEHNKVVLCENIYVYLFGSCTQTILTLFPATKLNSRQS